MNREVMGFEVSDRPLTGITISGVVALVTSILAYFLLNSLGDGPHGVAMSFVVFGPVAFALVSAALLFIIHVRRAALGAAVAALGVTLLWLIALLNLGLFGKAL